VFDVTPDDLILQQLGILGDMVLKRTTNPFQVWRGIRNPEKMINGEVLMVLLK